MPDNTLAIRVSAIDEASPVFDKVGHNAKKLKNDAEGAGLEGGIEKLKEGFGRGSELHEGLEALKGAGPAAAIGATVELLSEGGTKANEFAQRLGEGSIKAHEIPLAFAESLPVIGGIVEGVKDWALALSGITYASAVVEKANAEEESRIERKIELQRHLNEITVAGAEEVAQAKQALDRSGLTEVQAKQQQIEDDKANASTKAGDDERAALQKAQDDWKKADKERPQDRLENELAFRNTVSAISEKQMDDISVAQMDALTKHTEADKAAAENLAKMKTQAAAEEKAAAGEQLVAKLQANADAMKDGVAKIQAEADVRLQVIQNAKDAEMEAIQERYKERVKNAPDEATVEEAQKEAKAERDRADAKAQIDSQAAIAEQHRDATAKYGEQQAKANEKLDKQIAGEKDLRDVREQGMQAAADEGNLQAKQALNLARIQDKYIEDADKLRKILTDPAATLALKQQAAAQLEGLQAQEKQALQLAATRAREHIGADVAEDASHLTGNNLGNLNSTEDPNVEANKATAAATKDLNDFFTKYIQPLMPQITTLLGNTTNPTGIMQPG